MFEFVNYFFYFLFKKEMIDLMFKSIFWKIEINRNYIIYILLKFILNKK